MFDELKITTSCYFFILYLIKGSLVKIIKFSFIISVILIIINHKIIIFRKKHKTNYLPSTFTGKYQLSNNYMDFEVKRYQYLLDSALSNILLHNESNETILKYEKPKISVIISVYNREKYIKHTLTSVQNQNMKDIEIIIVDDFSIDNSVKIIQQEIKKDKRIVLYKNDKNMGNLYTKSVGVKMAKGEYVLSLDSDDILLPDNLLNSIYEEAKKKNFDIVEFESIWVKKYRIENNTFIHKLNFELYQPKLSKGFWIKNIDKKPSCFITAKIIKNKIYQKALQLIGEKNLKIRLTKYDDNLIMFIVYTFARSFKHINKYGYLAYRHNDSSSHENDEVKSYNSIIYISFLHKHYNLFKKDYIYLKEIKKYIKY